MSRGPEIPVYTNPTKKQLKEALSAPRAVVVSASLDGMFAEACDPNQVTITGLKKGKPVSRETVRSNPWPSMATVLFEERLFRRAVNAAVKDAARAVSE